jgi:hypothetical protein
MQKATYMTGAIYFYIGSFLALLLSSYTSDINYYLGYGSRPEVGLDLGMLVLLGYTAVYYTIFFVVQDALARFNPKILSPNSLWPLSFASGAVVMFTLALDLDFLVWIVELRNSGTIYFSTLIVEIILLLMNFWLVWHIENQEKLAGRRKWIAFFMLAIVIILLNYGMPMLLDIGLGSEGRHLWLP